MPAWLFILRIGGCPVPLPWCLFWLLAMPFVLLTTLVGAAAGLAGVDTRPIRFLRGSWRVLMLLICLHGLRIDVIPTDSRRVQLQFI